MTTKKKFWWALGSLALMLVVAATSVGITIAALQAQVNSSFSISYTAKNVKAVVFAGYQVNYDFSYANHSGNDALRKTSILPIAGKKYVEIKPDEEIVNQKFDDLTLSLDSTNLMNTIKQTIILSGWATEQNFDQAKLVLGDGFSVQINIYVINFDKENALPIHCQAQNLSKNGDVAFAGNFSIDGNSSGDYTDDNKLDFSLSAGTLASLEELVQTAKEYFVQMLFLPDWDTLKVALKSTYGEIESDEEFVMTLMAGLRQFSLSDQKGLGATSNTFTFSSYTASADISGNFSITLG